MSYYVDYDGLSDDELKAEFISHWVGFLRWNKTYLKYCGAVQEQDEETRLDMERKTLSKMEDGSSRSILSAIYDVFGDIYGLSYESFKIDLSEVIESRLSRFSVIKKGRDFNFSFPAGLLKNQVIERFELFFNENPDAYKKSGNYEILIHPGETLKSTCQRLYGIRFVSFYFRDEDVYWKSLGYAGIANEIYSDEDFKRGAGLNISSKSSAEKTVKRYHEYFTQCVNAALSLSFPPKLVNTKVANEKLIKF